MLLAQASELLLLKSEGNYIGIAMSASISRQS